MRELDLRPEFDAMGNLFTRAGRAGGARVLLFGYAMTHLGKKGAVVHQFIETCSQIFFGMMNALMKLAPIGAGGAMAFTIGRYGVDALKPLAALMGSFYLTCAIFILIVLGSIAAFTAFSTAAAPPSMKKNRSSFFIPTTRANVFTNSAN